ncbi:MAG: pseudouridine synthase [Clostridium fessum]
MLCLRRGGIVKGEARIEGWLTKNEKTNQVSIRKEETPGSLPIRTAYRPLASGNGYTLLEVHLITGRSHQIRAHLASIGHPIAGDPKYGDPRVNEEVKKRFGVRSQMLHAWRLVMPETISEPLSYLAGKEFTAPMPAEMKRMEEMMKSAPKRPANHRL